jgi:hypothetical protein
MRYKGLFHSKTFWINVGIFVYCILGFASEKIHILSDHGTIMITTCLNIWLRVNTDSKIDGV